LNHFVDDGFGQFVDALLCRDLSLNDLGFVGVQNYLLASAQHLSFEVLMSRILVSSQRRSWSWHSQVWLVLPSSSFLFWTITFWSQEPHWYSYFGCYYHC